MATLNYIVPRSGVLIATSGLVTVTPQKSMSWTTNTSDTIPTVEAKHNLVAGVDKSFNLDDGERLFVYKINASVEETLVAVTADNPASGNV